MVKQFFDVYTDLFGVYPFAKESFTIGQLGSGASDRQTAIFVSEYEFQRVAHELAHQWFGCRATPNTWEQAFLNESFATWATSLCVEKSMANEVVMAGEEILTAICWRLPSLAKSSTATRAETKSSIMP